MIRVRVRNVVGVRVSFRVRVRTPSRCSTSLIGVRARNTGGVRARVRDRVRVRVGVGVVARLDVLRERCVQRQL